MTSRVYGWTQESVYCLNIIDIVFADDNEVRNAWKDLYDKYCVQNPDESQLKKIETAQYRLLETIWNDGRKFDINRVLYRTTSSINEYDGIRYTVLIGNMEKFIYQYGREWYVMA